MNAYKKQQAFLIQSEKPAVRYLPLHEQGSNVVHDAGQNKGIADIEQRYLHSPFERMGFLVGRGKCHQAGVIGFQLCS